MSPIKTLVLLAGALLSSAAFALSPSDGHIAGKAYVNSYFHLTYAWPSSLTPQSLPTATADSGGKAYAFHLFSALQKDPSYGVVLVAEKLNIAGPHSNGVQSSVDYISRIEHGLKPGPILSNIVHTQRKNTRGMVFEELSYLQNGRPASVMATQVGEYLLVFKSNAPSSWDMAQIESSVLSARVTK